jgi:hypothetical protein
LENLKSGWHENIKIFITKGIQADIPQQGFAADDFCNPVDSIIDNAASGEF